MGRHVPGKAKEKHKIKRVDRLLGNSWLGAERRDIYRCMSHQLLGATCHPNILVDRHRMAIEGAFRDLKAYRHGFAFRLNLSRKAERVANLLLLAALATWVVWLTGSVGVARAGPSASS